MIRLGLFNANGISGKINLCQDLIKTELIDLFFICESKISADATGYGDFFLNVTKQSHARNPGGFGKIGGILGWASPRLDGHLRAIMEEEDHNGAIIAVGDTLVIGIGYFPPEENNQGMTNKMLKFMSDCLSIAGDRPLILLGDFNSRLGQINGDHLLNGRGRRLLAWLGSEGSSLNLEQPVSGKYTCFTHWGRGYGITELVLSKDVCISGYKVFEWNSLGGSDHRPLVIDVGYQPPPPRAFGRWNIRKLATEDVRKHYQECLAANLLQASWALQSDHVDSIWCAIKSAIEDAAIHSCDIFNYKSPSNPIFWTVELTSMLQSIRREEEAWHELFQTHPNLAANARSRLRDLNNDLREALRARKKQLFLEEYSQFDNPQLSAAFLKRIKCKKARMSRSNCILDPKKINEYSLWFGTTFGQPSTEFTPTSERQTEFDDLCFENLCDEMEVKTLLDKCKLGKSTGFDNLYGEFFRYGASSLTPFVTHLFNMAMRKNTVPSDWKETKIVPIFKKKGDPAIITNYRPIALTSFARRLFEKVIQRRLNHFTHNLSPFQAGFREHRNTVQQVLHLLEIGAHNPDLHHVFIDIKTAYDTVNRKRLWWLMRNKYRVPDYLLDILKTLFDENYSKLVVGGCESDPIPNQRGLLQGSALSPMLFNFYINELLLELDSLPDTLKVSTHGLLTNHLHFADDGNIHATSLVVLRKLLEKVENWSMTSDCVISLDKTVYMGPSDLIGTDTLYLLRRPIKKVNDFEYLGVFINSDGINWPKVAGKRCNSARGVISLLSSVGMNATGWPLTASLQAYKSFIRPVMEYGLAIEVLRPTNIAMYQAVQNLALRRIFGAPRNCSTQALHKLAKIETMEHRNWVLNASLLGRIHNSVSKSNPIVRLYREATTASLNHRSPIQRSVKKNPIIAKSNRIPLLFHPISDDQHCSGPIIEALPVGLKKELRVDHIRSLKSGVAEPITVDAQSKIHCVFSSSVNQRIRVTISRWMLGLVAQHQLCQNCMEQELSRAHAIHCLQIEEQLLSWYPCAVTRPQGRNVIDFLLDQFRLAPPDEEFLGRMSEMIGMIFIVCRRMEQDDNGFWKVPPNVTGITSGTVGTNHSSRRSDFRASAQDRPPRTDTFPVRGPPQSPTSRRRAQMRRRHLQNGRPISQHFRSMTPETLLEYRSTTSDLDDFENPPPFPRSRSGIG